MPIQCAGGYTLAAHPVRSTPSQAASEPTLKLRSYVQIILSAVAVKRAGLILVERVVLERGVVEIFAVERQRDRVSEGVLERRCQSADRVLRECRTPVEAAEERGPVRV